ncbi:MAG: hypothetical protein H6917_16780 [Novosphingobium sp.]|nr:hypothetical protein [Novosphingobium sp.]MCP5404029.1 hypothetical protein [Novosphingobium sp.]
MIREPFLQGFLQYGGRSNCRGAALRQGRQQGPLTIGQPILELIAIRQM